MVLWVFISTGHFSANMKKHQKDTMQGTALRNIRTKSSILNYLYLLIHSDGVEWANIAKFLANEAYVWYPTLRETCVSGVPADIVRIIAIAFLILIPLI